MTMMGSKAIPCLGEKHEEKRRFQRMLCQFLKSTNVIEHLNDYTGCAETSQRRGQETLGNDL